MNIDIAIFKDYDIRGVYPTQINGSVFEAISHAIVREFHPKSIAICRDMRLSGDEIFEAMKDVFLSLGIDVADAGLSGTEMQYFIAGTKMYDLVVMISASHNPPEYNGMKLVKKGPIAVTSESGLFAVRNHISEGPLPSSQRKGNFTKIDVWKEWKDAIVSLVDLTSLKPFNIVIDAGNGMGGKICSAILDGTPIHYIPLYFEPDGHFPNHVPNPLIPKNNETIEKTIRKTHADLGFTFDGDADRIFLIDDKGRLVSGTVTTALLARYILQKHPGELILYNAICGRIVPQIIKKYGGQSKRVRVGHSYIKTYMRETGAIFAGEHSGHYYFRDFFMAESGILAGCMILSLLSNEDKPLSAIVDELDIYPASGEINFTSKDIPYIVQRIRTGYPDALSIDELDGISVWYTTYWFNVRASKTEPVLRLNIEADTQAILEKKKTEIVHHIISSGGSMQ